MQGTIEIVSATGKGFRIVGQEKGQWFNKGKMLDEDAIASLKKGDNVDFDAPDGKWVTKLKKMDGDVTHTGGDGPAPSAEMAKVFAPKSQSGQKSDAQSRGCAANSVIGSPYIAELLKGGCEEETVQNIKNFMTKVAEFVHGGNW